MKARIIGIIILALVLGAVYVITQGTDVKSLPVPSMGKDDAALKALSL